MLPLPVSPELPTPVDIGTLCVVRWSLVGVPALCCHGLELGSAEDGGIIAPPLQPPVAQLPPSRPGVAVPLEAPLGVDLASGRAPLDRNVG